MKRSIYLPLVETSTYIKVCFVTLLVTMAFLQSSAQSVPDKRITGIVRFSEDNDVAPGVNIYLKGSTSTGTYSDASGKFEFPGALKPGDILVFSFIGRKTFEYVVPALSASPIEILLAPEYIQMVEEPLTEGQPARTSAFARLFKLRDRAHQ